MAADSTDMKHAKQVISCSPVSCLINTKPLDLLCLQLSEPIASESVEVVQKQVKCGPICFNSFEFLLSNMVNQEKHDSG